MASSESTSMKKVLVVYYSLSGNTARVARDLAKRIGADIESIQDKEHSAGFFGYLKAVWDAARKTPANIGDVTLHPSQYELTVVGTPVWAGNMTPAVRGYLHRCQGRFNHLALFTTSGNTDVLRILPQIEAAARCEPVACEGFNARELGDSAVYDRKLAGFVSELGLAPRAPDVKVGEPVRAR